MDGYYRKTFKLGLIFLAILVLAMMMTVKASAEIGENDIILETARDFSNCKGVYEGLAEIYKSSNPAVYETMMGQSRGAELTALILYNTINPVKKLGDNLPMVNGISYGGKIQVLSFFELAQGKDLVGILTENRSANKLD